MPKPQISAIVNRRSVRKYKDTPIDKKTMDTILLSAMQSPSAHNAKKWEYILVEDRKTIQTLSEMKPNSKLIANAGAVVIVCSEEWQYWLEDASIVTTHILLEAKNQELDTCWVEVRDGKQSDGSDNEQYVRNILNIPKDIRVLCMVAIGVADEEKSPHSDEELNREKVHLEKW